MSNVKIQIRPGLLDRLKKISGLVSDEAFARAIGTSRATLINVRNGEREPSMAFAVGIAQAFGLGLSEIVVWKEQESSEAA